MRAWVPKRIQKKAKYYRERALSSNDIKSVLECSLSYIIETENAISEKVAFNKQEVTEKLNFIIKKLSDNENLFASYILAEAYFVLTKIDETSFAEHYKKAIEYSKKSYDIGKKLANHRILTDLYGEDFFDFNEEYDYVCYDIDKFNGYEIAGKKITYVPSMSTKANNYSIDYWLPRARFAYAMYRDYEDETTNTYYYKRAISVNSTSGKIEFKNIVYPNALYVLALRFLLGYEVERDEERATRILKLCAERYHSRGALLYGKACELKGDYENAFNFYKIAYSKVYPETVKRKESLPTVLLKPGEKITYIHYYEYGGEKKPCYEALENIILNYQAFLRLSSTYEQYKVFEEYLNSGYKSARINEICEAFEKYSPQDKYECLVENNLDIVSSPKAFEMLLTKSKKEEAVSVLDNILNTGDLDSVKLARDIATWYGINEQDRITKRLIELGDKDEIAIRLIKGITDYNNIPTELADLAKENNQIAIAFFNENYDKSNTVLSLGVEIGAEKCLEKYSLMLIEEGQYEKAKEVNPKLLNHSIWGYLLYNRNEDTLPAPMREALRLLRLPTELDAKETSRETDVQFILNKPRELNKDDVDRVISYANRKKEYLKCGIYLVSQSITEGFLLLTKHYMGNIDNLLKLCEIVLLLQGGYINKNVYSFNKAMCLLSKGGFLNKNKAKSILSDIVSLKGATKLEKIYLKPYQPAVDFLDGKEVNEEYLLNIRSKNG